MRQRAIVKDGKEYKKLIVYETEKAGTYLFVFRSELDTNGCGDYWYSTIAEAKESALECFGIELEQWQSIADPEPDDFHDWDPLVETSSPKPKMANLPVVGYSLQNISSDLRNNIFRLLEQGMKLSAIRLYHQQMGVGLVESKYCVDFLDKEFLQIQK